MTDIPEKFVEEQVEKLKDRDDVNAVSVVGSYARNPEGDHNDLDIYVIVDGDWKKRETEEVDGVVVEKFFNSREWTMKYFEKDFWAHHYRWMTRGDVRYDPEGVFEEIAEEAEEIKEERMELSEEDRREIAYTIWDMRQDVESQDVAQKRFMMQKLFDYLLEKQYLLKDQLPVKENYRLEKLREFDGYMYKLSQDFLLSSSTMEKEKKLEEITEHVSRDLPELGPEWESGKEKF